MLRIWRQLSAFFCLQNVTSSLKALQKLSEEQETASNALRNAGDAEDFRKIGREFTQNSVLLGKETQYSDIHFDQVERTAFWIESKLK